MLVSASALVVDDFLPPDAFEALVKHFKRSSFARQDNDVEGRGDGRCYHFGDPDGYHTYSYDTSTPTVASSEDLASTRAITALFARSARAFPTNTAVDDLFDSLRELVKRWPREMSYGANVKISARGSMMPRGSSTKYSCDTGESATFSLFLNTQWNCEWGGELFWGPRLDRNEPVFLGGEPVRAVMPRTNRLVVLSSSMIHRFAEVDVNAGHNLLLLLEGKISWM